ncbi:hypothetical protein G3578_14330 [Brevibacillus sp. SYP-B805]|uniref:hypothetical protein n=1 Tax=Brevibacillus sp. SYP-B805 TaxID=1578199 RepID=UPI0013EBA9D2|nr:hypothetical protein [Brevibacillus sp. SYP-B805]NGQ96339.1 hypothetical protein [Brevibacillus sp. SYP-B805]
MKQHTRLAASLAVCAFLITNGCSSTQPPANQPAAEQSQPGKPAEPTPAPTGQAASSAGQSVSAGQAAPSAGQPASKGEQQPIKPAPSAQQPSTGGGEVKPAQKPTPANKNDYRNELVLYPSIVIGQTTMDDMIKAYGQPVKVETVPSRFREDIAKGVDSPAVEEVLATFKVNPLTGKKFNTPFPFYFTKDKKILVAAPIFFLRDGLFDKMKNNTITYQDVKNSYGEPVRESEKSIEFYDFDHKISLLVYKNERGELASLLTKYDLLYGSNTNGMKHHEAMVKLLKAIKGVKK